MSAPDRAAAAARLKAARVARYDTAAAAAEANGWSQVSYRSHENGIRGMRRSVAVQYARALGIEASDLITDDDKGQIQTTAVGNRLVLIEIAERVTPDQAQRIFAILDERPGQ